MIDSRGNTIRVGDTISWVSEKWGRRNGYVVKMTQRLSDNHKSIKSSLTVLTKSGSASYGYGDSRITLTSMQSVVRLTEGFLS